MPLLKDGKMIDDNWTLLDENTTTPEIGAVIVDLERWQTQKADLTKRNAPLGLLLLPGQSPEDLEADLDRFDLIAIAFPAFKDGRAYSYARLLRERFGFEGELRAVGEVLRDQLYFMHRVGFDAYEVDERMSENDFGREMAKFGTPYQPSSDGQKTVTQLRFSAAPKQAAE